MQVWNVLHVACWKYRMQKFAICAPLHNFIGLYFHNWGMYRLLEKNLLNGNISSTYSDRMVNLGALAAEIGSGVWGTPVNLNSFSIFASLLHRHRSTKVNQTLHSVWLAGTLYIHFWGLLPGKGILPLAKFTLRPSIAFFFLYCQRCCTHSWVSAKLWYVK